MTSAYSAFANQGVRMTPLPHPGSRRPRRQHPRTAPRRAARGDSRGHGVHHDEHPRGRHSARHRRRPPEASTGRSPARPARPTTTRTRGSSASIRTSPWASGWASIRSGRSASNQTGAVAALPIWQEIMKSWIARQRPARAEPPVFERPGNIVTVTTARGPKCSSPGRSRNSHLLLVVGMHWSYCH